MAVTAPSDLFIDSSAFIALSFADDRWHGAAQDYLASLTRRTRLTTTAFVMSETYTWLRYRLGYPSAALFLHTVQEMARTDWLAVVCPSCDALETTAQVLQRYSDQDLSYTDAASFSLIEERDIKDVFTFDRHFQLLRRRVWPLISGGKR